MGGWTNFLALAAIALMAFIWVAVLWRAGQNARAFLSAEFWLWVVGIPLIITATKIFWMIQEGEAIASLGVFGSLILMGQIAINGLFYALGFIHGRIKRSRNDAVIGKVLTGR